MNKLALIVLAATITVPAMAQNWVDNWLNNVSATQAEQPQWITPLATSTARLSQELRFDLVREIAGNDWVLYAENGKGLQIIPAHNIELDFNLPPYVFHENPKLLDGIGDTTFQFKYRLASRNEENGSYVVSFLLGGSVPTGEHKDGSISATVTPTLAAGKGFGRFDVQSAFGVTLPVNSTNLVGRTFAFNNTAQYHLGKYLWPEAEVNSSFYDGGKNDGKKQVFLTPGLTAGRFIIHNRISVSMGAGFQVAATHFSNYNHAVLATMRMQF